MSSQQQQKDMFISLTSNGTPTVQSDTLSFSTITTTLQKQWKYSKPSQKPFEQKTFYIPHSDSNSDTDTAQTIVAISSGAGPIPKTEAAKKEFTRKSAALGLKALKSGKSEDVLIDTVWSPHSAAVGAGLADFHWNLKTTTDGKEKLKKVNIAPIDQNATSTLSSESAQSGSIPLTWETGLVYAQAQNLARELMETPANLMTPTLFCQRAEKELSSLDSSNITINIHDKKWALEKKMASFISVNAGSAEPLRFLEVVYKGGQQDEKPLALVGKGITFDSGGISLKPGASMKEMRADMGGAAVTLSTAWAIAKLKLPVNYVLCIPLTDNMPSGTATHPGDCITASNGVTIEVDNTDAEGRLVLADALYYATSTYKPHTVIDVATLTGAMMIALGREFTGVFTNSDELFESLRIAGEEERDRVWRMPLDEGYMGQINHTGMDLCNTGGRLAGSCTAAIFLKRFVDGLIIDGKDSSSEEKLINWAHLDIAGVMDSATGEGYEWKGMSGRPVRTLVELVRRGIPS